uniref:nestin n=1 Tax=Doryrhamphus excisus TaxID=161450 RepID=UPI0025ADEB9F|nr:nestin [Doryrhamphus excisus]
MSIADMELLSTHGHLPRGQLAQEKHQMLDLNRRLESYLGRVKFLEEENMLLTQEIQALQRSNHSTSVRKKSMQEELRQTRAELDAAWRDRVCTEMEVNKLSEELKALDRHWQREAQAQAEAKTKLELSRKELEEEHRAQMWLRQKISQLEDEMSLLVQTHQQDVARLEGTLKHSRASVPPHFAQRGNPTSDLHQLEQELCHRASRAWQEMAETYEAQLVELEESLNQNRARLSQADREKSENQAKLRALERDMVSARDVRMHLERSADQQREEHRQNIHKLQEHWEILEKEKEDLGQQLDLLVLENRGLLQQKMSLSIEVATYSALLDGEGLRRDITLQKQPRNISFKDTSLKAFPENYRRHTTPISSPLHRPPAAFNATRLLRYKPETNREPQKEPGKPDKEDKTTTAKQEIPYPKILQNGAVEEFRAQEVDEKVTYAEPLSPSGEEDKLPDGDVCEDVVSVEEKAAVSLNHQSSLPPVSNEIIQQQTSSQEQTSDLLGLTEETFSSSAECGQKETTGVPTEALAEEVCAKYQEETSSSETEALLEATPESRTSSPSSQCDDAEEINISKKHTDEMRQEISYSTSATNEIEAVDMLYTDGEEMDTWDSVMEKKIYVEPNDPKPEAEYAEPEESISARRSEPCREEMKEQEDHISNHHGEHSQCSNNHDDEDEDSQNVSVSWRTELESDSYALDNTLADTRPLIRYKSDETDANTQASHVEESESSDGEQDQKTGDPVAWSESKAKNFGTMEDLCEEVEEEAVECEQEYARLDNATSEASEVILDEDVRSTPVVPENVLYDEEIDTDRLVELELENLSTDRYASHFAQHLDNYNQVELPEDDENEMMMMEQHVDQVNTCMESNGQAENNVDLKDFTKFLEEEKNEEDEEEEEEEEDDQDASEDPGRMEEDFHFNVSMETHVDEIQDPIAFSEFLNRTDIEEEDVEEEEIEEVEEEKVEEIEEVVEVVEEVEDVEEVEKTEEVEVVEVVEDVEEVEETEEVEVVEVVEEVEEVEETEEVEVVEVVEEVEEVEETEEVEVVEVVEEVEEGREEPESVLEKLQDLISADVQATSCLSAESLVEDTADCLAADWTVLENPREDLDIPAPKDEEAPCEESVQSRPCEQGGDNEGAAIYEKEPVEISPETTLEENVIFTVEDSAEFLKTNGKDKHDFWASSVEDAATFRADDNTTEDDNIMTFDGRLDWGKAVNGSSAHGHAPQKEGGLVHSEESEAEGGFWSSGDE